VPALTARHPAAGDLTRSSFALDRGAFSVAEGLRAGLSVAAIVFLHAWLHFPLLVVTALGALLTCLADGGTPGAERLRPMLAFALLGTALGIVFGLSRGVGLWLAIPLAGFAIAACSLARVYGQAAMQVGNLLAVWTVLALDTPLPSLTAAAGFGGMFLIGSLWALLLTSLLWRIQPFGPAQRAVADCYGTLAAMVDGMREVLATASDETSIARWESFGRTYRRAARDRIEAGRQVAMGVARSHGLAAPRVSRALLRVEVAEQATGTLIAISDILETHPPHQRAVAPRMLRHLRAVLLSLAHSIAEDVDADQPRLARSLEGIRDDVATLAVDAPLRRLVETLTERLAVAATLAAPKNLQPGTLADGASALPWSTRLLGPLEANLDLRSAALRHAAMSGLAGAIGLGVTLVQNRSYEHWFVITLLVTMQPYFSLTWQRMLERIGGTVLGGVVAAALGLAVHTPLTVSLALFPLAVIAFAVRRVSFALFLCALTPMVILLVESTVPGSSEVDIALMRALYTILGGVLAVICSLVLWSGRNRSEDELRQAILAHGQFARATFDALLGDDTEEAAEQGRRAASIASNNLEATLSRGMLEPRLAPRGYLEAALTVDASLRRLAGRLSAMRAIVAGQRSGGLSGEAVRADLAAWRDWVGGCVAIILAPRGGLALPPRPALNQPPEDQTNDSLARIARQLELIAEAVARFKGA
jgi:hypothetical protein